MQKLKRTLGVDDSRTQQKSNKEVKDSQINKKSMTLWRDIDQLIESKIETKPQDRSIDNHYIYTISKYAKSQLDEVQFMKLINQLNQHAKDYQRKMRGSKSPAKFYKQTIQLNGQTINLYKQMQSRIHKIIQRNQNLQHRDLFILISNKIQTNIKAYQKKSKDNTLRQFQQVIDLSLQASRINQNTQQISNKNISVQQNLQSKLHDLFREISPKNKITVQYDYNAILEGSISNIRQRKNVTQVQTKVDKIQKKQNKNEGFVFFRPSKK